MRNSIEIEHLHYKEIKLVETEDYDWIENIFEDRDIDQYRTYKFFTELYKENKIYKIINEKEFNPIGIVALYGIDTINKNACIDIYVSKEQYISEMKQSVICLLKYVFEKLNFEKLFSVFLYENKIYKEFWDIFRFVDGVLMRNHINIGTDKAHLYTKNILRHEYMRFYKNENAINKIIEQNNK